MKQLLLCLLFTPFLAPAQALRGHVQDAAGQPIPYASVVVPARHLGTTADAAGDFALPDLPAGPQQLEVSAVGYATARPAVVLPLVQPLVIKLVASEKALGEVVVTGVGRATEIRRSPVPIAAMTGREIRLNA
ncbi:MAG: carboxypeptidase-like regulatory domain-containing protein, partial [Cytophagaceae bacterium]